MRMDICAYGYNMHMDICAYRHISQFVDSLKGLSTFAMFSWIPIAAHLST